MKLKLDARRRKKNEKTIIESINEILRPKSRTTHALRTKTYWTNQAYNLKRMQTERINKQTEKCESMKQAAERERPWPNRFKWIYEGISKAVAAVPMAVAAAF